MLFNSETFWIFFLVVLGLYQLLGHRAQNLLLLLASYVFYGCWSVRFLALIAASTIIDYIVARSIEKCSSERSKRVLLGISIAANLGILGVFKYYGFFAGELAQLLDSVGLPAMVPTFHVVLPVGISFYTFQTMSYTIDVARGRCPATHNFWDFALYVAFFPQLVAGPIERATRFLPQITNRRRVTAEQVRDGVFLILNGLIRKIVIADNMAVLANSIFARPAHELTGWEVLLGTYAFAFQIYGDFSGYSSIARGVAKLLGFDLMTNFRMPYFAVSPSDFWRRWHISLSQWLRDYLYISLGGNRHGRWRTYRNLMLTMLLGGLWHGANWTFLIWGALHGLYLCLARILSLEDKDPQPIPLWRRILQMCVMFHLVCLGWLFFRADSLPHAFALLHQLLLPTPLTPTALTILGLLIVFCTPLLMFECWLESHRDPLAATQIHWTWRACGYACALMVLIHFPAPTSTEFIYFQF